MSSKRWCSVTLASAIALIVSTAGNAQPYVPDARTATAIAEAVLIPILGLEFVQPIKPFTAQLKGNEWYVTSQPKFAPKVYSSPAIVIVIIDRETGAVKEWKTAH